MIRGIVIALLCVVSAARGDGRPLTLDDLSALERQESWQELFEHLDDIPPTQRSDRWNQLVERSASGVLSSLADKNDRGFVFGDAVVRQYPSLKKSKRFMALRADVGLRGLEACLQYGSMSCVDRAVTYVDGDPANAELAWKLARAIARRDASSAVRVFRRALDIHHDAKDCADEPLKRAVVGALGFGADDVRVPDAQRIAADLCWDQVKDKVVDGFIVGAGDYRRNTCPFLLTKKDALSPMSRRQCEALKP